MPSMATSFRILGIDPGLERTGYGLIEAGAAPLLKAYGVFKSARTIPLEERLDILHTQLFAFLEEQNPHVVVLEQLYSHYDHPVTAILMGHARGIICLAAAQRKIPLVSYAATRVKKAVTGNGGASKEQVQRMVCHLLGIKTLSGPLDVTDALALALAHANIGRLEEKRLTQCHSSTPLRLAEFTLSKVEGFAQGHPE
ncbi:MAG: crossover junction endodeoxyribonuclease RuvC [Candidatus Omnitrophica bacterium]|nr:crossover junction endodeoxyribonuclease RuvC [Candidatus Omnitrophota bacterium]